MRYALLPPLTLLTACASIGTELPDIAAPDLAAEQKTQEVLAFDQLEALRERLARVSQPILQKNAKLCPKTRPSIGLATHDVKSYPKAMREAARREVGATDEPSVAFLVAGGPADRAGIKKGDILLGPKGDPIHAGHKSIKKSLEAGEALLTLKRGEAVLEKRVTPETLCNYPVTASMNTDINAYATGRNIIVTSGMMEFVRNDDELALIIGHELAHNTMGHIPKIVGNIILSAGGTRYTRPFESEADYVGLYYMTRAGYNPDGVEDVWRRIARVNPKSVVRAKTHPTTPDRYLRIAATRDEIAKKQAAEEALIPNFKPTMRKKLDLAGTDPS